MTRHTLVAETAPQAVGPYSHAASADPAGLLFLSGQTPIDPATGHLVEGGIDLQTRRIFANIAEVLAAATLTLDDVVKVTVYLTSMDDFAEMNKAYGEMFSEPYPARTTIAVAALPLGANVEIEVVAAPR